jgi:hypothetical protein
MKNTDPVMGAKLKSKTHLQNTFFLFFEPFFAHLASKFAKSANMTPNFFFFFLIKKYSKKQNFVEKFVKNAPKKSYKQNKFEERKCAAEAIFIAAQQRIAIT